MTATSRASGGGHGYGQSLSGLRASLRPPRSFYCSTHIAALWRQVWDHRPETSPRPVTASAR